MSPIKTFDSETMLARESAKSPPMTITETTIYPKITRMEDFLENARHAFEDPLEISSLMTLSARLQEQFKEKLQSSDISMLPSYNYTLPTGEERGNYLALDIGGTNFRVALVELRGRREDRRNGMKIVKMFSHRISGPIRALKGREFFAWMAERIEDAINDAEVLKVHGDGTFLMGVAWSFPIEYISLRCL
jgi:hexokinase